MADLNQLPAKPRGKPELLVIQRRISFTTFHFGGTFSDMGPSNEESLAALVILGICALAIYRFVIWLKEGPRSANPWGNEIDEALDRGEGLPLCHHCLTPQDHNGWFCPECGATVGPYCNYLPYVYIFSQGEVLRAGVTERFRRGPLIVIGLVLCSLALCAVLAPIYWFFLFKHLRHSGDAGLDAPPLNG